MLYSLYFLALYVYGIKLFFLKEKKEKILVNPRRACAARVTVVVLCVCLFVCLSVTILALQATRRLMSDTNSYSATRVRKVIWRFCEKRKSEKA